LRKYKSGTSRQQTALLPPSVDEYVSEGNPVRAIDAYVDTLDLAFMGVKNSQAGSHAGQPAYHPRLLIKLYLYGYLNGIRSSRKLEREAGRNLEVIWLVEGLNPVYKTIANFRKDNSQTLTAINKDFILLCKQLGLFAGETVAVDGSFFKGNASKDSIYTEKALARDLLELDKKIAAYQAELDAQDRRDDQSGLGSLVEDSQLQEKIEKLKDRQAGKQALQQQLANSSDSQLSTVDKDARLLSKNGKSVAGYNVQIVVDSHHKLIVAQEVTQDSSDIKQLSPMLEKAQAVLQSGQLNGLADAGYYSFEQLKQADDKGIAIYVPVPKSDGRAVNKGVFARERFSYDPGTDSYRCPNGGQLHRSGGLKERQGRRVWTSRSKASMCNSCSIRGQCLGEKTSRRAIERWEHEHLVEQHKQRMQGARGIMKQRSGMVEHPFGTLKHRAGMHHFLMRGLEKCRGEFGLMTLCYNFTRVLNLLGADKLREYCLQRAKHGFESPLMA